MKKLEIGQMEVVNGAYNPQKQASPEFCAALAKTTAGMAVIGAGLAFTGFGGLLFGAAAGGLAIFSLTACY